MAISDLAAHIMIHAHRPADAHLGAIPQIDKAPIVSSPELFGLVRTQPFRRAAIGRLPLVWRLG
jgi:hypothetical protein